MTWPIYIWLHDKCPCSKLYHKNSDKKPGFCFTKVTDPKVWKIIPFSFNSDTKMYINVWNFMLIGHIYIFWTMYTHIYLFLSVFAVLCFDFERRRFVIQVCGQWVSQVKGWSRLLHSSLLEAVGLSVGYETWSPKKTPIGYFAASDAFWAHVISGNFHRFSDPTDSLLAQP